MIKGYYEMKKLLCFVLVLALVAGGAFAETEEPAAETGDGLATWSAPEKTVSAEDDWQDTGETIIMRIGARNQGVRMLQTALIDRGYLDGEADGAFGSGTKDAVRAFQEAEGMVADGYVRLSTLRALDEKNAAKELLDIGDSGLLVYGVQKLMNLYGYLADSPDGKFGSGTKRGVRYYMERVVDDMVDYTTARVEAEAAYYSEQAQADDGTMPIIIDVPIITSETVHMTGAIDEDWMNYMVQSSVPVGEEVTANTRGNDVYRMQRRLKALGYTAGRADGLFGTGSYLALKYFQRRNGLDETGILTAETQKLLFSDLAEASDIYVSPYAARVSTKKCKVWIYKWTGDQYGDLVKTFVCSTGKASTPTIKGTFQAPGQNGVWYKMDGCWVMYAFVIDGGYFFHSVLFNKQGDKKPTSTSVANLGKNVSHGCIRLTVEDAKWIYENCLPGMTVVIE